MWRRTGLLITNVSKERVASRLLAQCQRFSSLANILSWSWGRQVPPKRRSLQDPHGSTSRGMAFFLICDFRYNTSLRFAWGDVILKGVSKIGWQYNSKCYSVGSPTKTFSLKGVQTPHRTTPRATLMWNYSSRRQSGWSSAQNFWILQKYKILCRKKRGISHLLIRREVTG
jgi:hypothetical protein